MEAPLMHLALVGTPNSGKTSLFNALTGSRQKVANYPGVTVERKEGSFVTPLGRQVSVVDLPGTYSLRGRSPDEEITRDFLIGTAAAQRIGAGQIDHRHLAAERGDKRALLALHRDARIVRDFLAAAGKGVEQRGLAAVRRAHQGQMHQR